jgi:hypothetical protein
VGRLLPGRDQRAANGNIVAGQELDKRVIGMVNVKAEVYGIENRPLCKKDVIHSGDDVWVVSSPLGILPQQLLFLSRILGLDSLEAVGKLRCRKVGC